MRHAAEREAIVSAGRSTVEEGLNRGSCGNVSVRVEGGFLVTPTGIPYDALRAEQVVEVHLDGTVPPGQLAPSSEWRFHCDIYAERADAGAVVHAHPPFSTALACLRRSIPAFHYLVAVAGGDDIRCAEYATYGTPELSRNALTALEGRRACLLANHGLLVFADALPAAVRLAVEVETLAAQYVRALSAGEPVVLDAAEMERVLAKFRTYGRQPPCS